MSNVLTADDLLPLVQKLTRDEQLHLARRALKMAALTDAEAYRSHPPSDEEFSADSGSLDWDADGWEPFDEAR
ncbi:MAG: hypothetical protein AAFU79_06975 [Myxococcota bacterium]